MATKTYEFTGPVKWAKVWEKQLDRKFAFTKDLLGNTVPTPYGGKWDIVVNLKGDELAKFQALGTKLKAARLDDPEMGIEKGDVRFKRTEFHPKLGALNPPVVTGVEPGTAIGNGSNCTVSVDVYDYPQPDGTKGFAVRLKSVHVNDLVEYVKSVEQEGPPV